MPTFVRVLPKAAVLRRIAAVPEHRRKLLQIAAPHDPRVLAGCGAEGVPDPARGQELGHAPGAGHGEVVGSASEPQQVELLVYLLGVGDDVPEGLLRVVAASTEHAEAAEDSQV